MLYVCVLCKYMNGKRRNLYQHLKKKHKISIMIKKDGTTSCVVEPNADVTVVASSEGKKLTENIVFLCLSCRIHGVLCLNLQLMILSSILIFCNHTDPQPLHYVETGELFQACSQNNYKSVIFCRVCQRSRFSTFL